MQRVSSNLTIFFKIFLPTSWIAFFGPMTIAFIIAENANLPFGGGALVRFGFLGGFLLFLLLIYIFLIPLKRVEFSSDGIYVSNYFKTFRYQYMDLKKVTEFNLGFFTLGTLVLKEKGKFGKKIRFLISMVNYRDFINNNPSLFNHLKS